jgi:hypothetical protein
MQFFRKTSSLETLQQQLRAIDSQITSLNMEIQNLTDNSKMDSVLKFWLEARFGFSYDEQKVVYNKLLNEKKAMLSNLTKEKQKIETQLQILWEKERLRVMKIRFEGQGILDSDGSICRIQCQNCKNVYVHDFKTYGAFENILACTSQNELQFLYNRGINVFEVKCPKCNASVVIKVFRGRV